MKILAILAAVVLLVIVAIFYFGNRKLDLATATPTPVEAAKLDFTALSTLLQQDMSNIPVSLDAPRVAPANAFHVRSRLQGATAPLPAYQTLGQACELIIDADQEHSVRRAENQQSADPALRARTQANWDDYRLQTDAEVRRLLAALPKEKP